MPRYMLDTNMCIYLMKHQPAAIARRFALCRVGDVIISAITYAELEYGVVAIGNGPRERRRLAALTAAIPVAPFDGAAAVAYGPVTLATHLRKRDQLDKLIAAHALALDIILVTNNVRDFAHYAGVKIENWLDE